MGGGEMVWPGEECRYEELHEGDEIPWYIGQLGRNSYIDVSGKVERTGIRLYPNQTISE